MIVADDPITVRLIKRCCKLMWGLLMSLMWHVAGDAICLKKGHSWKQPRRRFRFLPKPRKVCERCGVVAAKAHELVVCTDCGCAVLKMLDEPNVCIECGGMLHRAAEGPV